MRSLGRALVASVLVAVLTTSGCGGGDRTTVSIDGSSTVYPITEAVAEEFKKVQPEVRVTVGVSGTSGGFRGFCTGDTDINDASRPIKGKEIEKAKANSIDFIELPVAYDGISVVVNPANDFCTDITPAELAAIWGPGSQVTKWSDVRSTWPSEPIKLFGPGTSSGTFDYFTEAINGESGACRADFTASEDDNVLVTGVAGETYAMGFFGFAYYIENQERLRVVPVVTSSGPVAPSQTTINDGTYVPLSRPVFIYVGSKAARRTEVRDFVHFYLKNADNLAADVGYVALPDRVYELARQRFDGGVTGSVYHEKETHGIPLEILYALGDDTRG